MADLSFNNNPFTKMPDLPEPPKQPVGPVAPEKLTPKQQLQKDCQTAGEKIGKAQDQQATAKERLDKANSSLMDGAMPPDYTPTAAALKEQRDAQFAADTAAAALEAAVAEANAAAEALEAYKKQVKIDIQDSYIVHWAEISCSCGLKNARPNFLKLETGHGIFVKSIPQLHIWDQKAFENIIEFMGCTSPRNPRVQEAAEEAAKAAQVETNTTKTFWGKEREVKVDDSLAQECSGACEPLLFPFDLWTSGKEKVKIDGWMPLLGRSKLYCKYGGIIEFDTSGQPE